MYFDQKSITITMKKGIFKESPKSILSSLYTKGTTRTITMGQGLFKESSKSHLRQ